MIKIFLLFFSGFVFGINLIPTFVSTNNEKQVIMSSIEILTAAQNKLKPVFLIETIEEIISERDYMESNWNESMRPRMNQLGKYCFSKFGKLLSQI
jgi:hypothetical protein